MTTLKEESYFNNRIIYNNDEKEELEKIIEDNFNCLKNFKNQCIYCDEDLGSIYDSRQLCNKLNCIMFINNIIKIK